VGDGKAALKLTTARYYTPSGICIHEKGIEPDIKVPLNFAQMKALHEHLSITNIDSKINEAEEKDTGLKGKAETKEKPQYTDIQLERAMDILKGIEVYEKHTNSPH
jgi:carboxyl-terminal processing protease